jgi:hypothetical protein
MTDTHKFWVPLVVPVITSCMVLFFGFEMQDKKDNDRLLLNEVKDIKTTLTKSAVIFGQMAVELSYIKEDVQSNSARLTIVEQRK